MHVVAVSKSKMANTEMVKDNRLSDGRAAQARILSEVSAYVKQTSDMHPIGRLVSISIGNIPEVAVYVRNQSRAAKKTGIPFDQMSWSGDIS